MIAPNSYGALSTTSANTIQGKAPTFTGQSGANKLGFKVGNTLYSEAEGNIESNTIKELDGGLSLNDFQITTINVSDFNPLTDYLDEDGDEAHPTRPLTTGSYGYEWRDGNNNIIRDYTKTIGCGSGLSLPLKLKIDLNGVQVHSKYGNPSASKSTTLTKTYQIGTASGICFAAPSNLEVHTSKNGRAGGYTEDFIPNKGFKANPTLSRSKFPTTGYPGAKFQLVMTGSQTDYTYEVEATPVGSVEVNTDGFVTLNSKPRGTVTVTAKLKRDPRITHDYSFNPTTLWGEFKYNPNDRDGWYVYYLARSACGGEANLPTRRELTNAKPSTVSEYKNPGMSTGYGTRFDSVATRAISGQFFPEWGNFSGSSAIWTKENKGSKGSGEYYVVGVGFDDRGNYFESVGPGAIFYEKINQSRLKSAICIDRS
ncbi:hypothetical protein RCS94_06835 [Orbaceae bacterium ac157xtp]